MKVTFSKLTATLNKRWKILVWELEMFPDRMFRWRLFEEYAGGPVTDLYPHSATQIIDILGVSMPDTVVAVGERHHL